MPRKNNRPGMKAVIARGQKKFGKDYSAPKGEVAPVKKQGKRAPKKNG